MGERNTFFQNVRISKLLTKQQFSMAVETLAHVKSAREIAKTLVSLDLLTKFQAGMLLHGRNSGFFLGPYRILDLLGQGGMGRVYKAMHQTMNRIVALKILSPQMVKTARAHQLFLREVQAAAKLNHPNIVMAYDANEIGGRHYLAMEFVDGPNLEQYVRKNGSLPVGMACEIIFQTAAGLQHAHERGMVHRDIKPANLLFQPEPGANTGQVKILDFGLARFQQPVLASAKPQAMDAKDNIIMGTPDFLSPEQSMNSQDIDIRSDLYSLGCTFYHILTSKVVFPGGTSIEKLMRHGSEIPRPIEELRPDIPKVVADIVTKLTEKRPEDRYQTPDELMEALSPHAVPSVLNWQAPAPTDESLERAPDEPILPSLTGDTEPRAQASTLISDQESILEWANVSAQARRRSRIVIATTIILCGLCAAALAWTAWVYLR